MSSVEKKEVKSLNIPLKGFTLGNDYLTVTEWSNGEGWDIYVGDNHIGLTVGQLRAINVLTSAIDCNFNISNNG